MVLSLNFFLGVSSLESDSNFNIYLEKTYSSDAEVLLAIKVK